MEMRRERKLKVARAVVAVVVIAAIIAVAAILLGKGGNGPVQGQDITPVGGTEVRIPVSEVTGDAKYYSVDASGTRVSFFVLRGKDGQVHVATDACDVCYGSKKGYRQDGDMMVCNNCGKSYAIASIGTENVQGGCWPSYLPMHIDGNDVVLEVKDVTAKAYMFR
jgi:uncharacterized membrane protein